MAPCSRPRPSHYRDNTNELIPMFDLPIGKPIKKTITVEDGSIQPFDHGIITTWLGRRKTPSGHRLVRAGRIVAWICENETGKYLITGNEAKNRLSEIEQAGSRLEAQQYSMAGLGSVAEIIPESFEFNADRQLAAGVKICGAIISHRAQCRLEAAAALGGRRNRNAATLSPRFVARQRQIVALL